MSENEFRGEPHPEQPAPPDHSLAGGAGQGYPPSEHPTNVYQPVQPHTNVFPPASGTGYQSYGAPLYDTHEHPYGQAAYPPAGSPPPPESMVPPREFIGSPPGPPRRRRAGSALAIAAIAALIGGGVGAGTVAFADRNRSGSVDTGLKITNTTGAPAAQTDGTVAGAAAKIRPSVVTIEASGDQSSGTGSGVIIRDDGHILTNDHVVSLGANGAISVTLADGRIAKATIVGRDSSDDLAVIKVDGLDKLTPATFAKSSALTVGQAVVAVGAPLGLSDTVTSGIVSNTARPVRAGDNDQAVFEAVQTDAAINPGNSGGPLVDLNGSVVGINAAIASDSSGGGLQIPGQPVQQAGNIGIGFAIPSDEASRIAGELIASGKAYHAVLGVTVGGAANTTQAGVPLRTVVADGAASKAGLKVGDIITAVDDQRVTTSDALIAAVRSHAPGEQVKLSYTRAGSSSTAIVTLNKSDS